MDGKEFVIAIFIAVFLVVIGRKVLSELERRRRRRTSLTWPLVKATIFRGSVDAVGRVESGVVHRLEVWFGYSAGQKHCGGSYTEQFHFPGEAEQMLQSLKAGPFFVRYDPANPSDCFVDPYRDVREQVATSSTADNSNP